MISFNASEAVASEQPTFNKPADWHKPDTVNGPWGDKPDVKPAPSPIVKQYMGPDAIATGTRLIMLRRDPKTPREGGTGRWLMRILGVEGFRKDEVPLPVAREATLRDVLAHLASEYKGELGGCWLLVAP